MSSKSLGTLFIAIAAIFWATDALFRAPLAQVVSPVFIVLFEHLIGVIALLLWNLLLNRKKLRGYPFKSWLALFLIGAGGSALATVLFTASFRYINPSVAILIQKLQPILVIVLAFSFLREKPRRNFWGWALLALASAIVVGVPHFDFSLNTDSKGVMYALVAASLWAASTVAGKSVSGTLPPSVIAFWRYAFGLLTLLGLFGLAVSAGESIPFSVLHQGRILRALLYIAAIPGIAGLVFYYSGLKRASAISATFTELLFPVSAVVLNWVFLGASLSIVQILAGVVLLFSVSRISLAVN
jgi:drug/metabolite transporter (DMT)-like permease